MSKPHYAFNNFNLQELQYNSCIYKIRGVPVDKKDVYQIIHWTYLLDFMLKNNLNTNDIFIHPNEGVYEHFNLIKLGSWRHLLPY